MRDGVATALGVLILPRISEYQAPSVLELMSDHLPK
jgi:hypothetical protein